MPIRVETSHYNCCERDNPITDFVPLDHKFTTAHDSPTAAEIPVKPTRIIIGYLTSIRLIDAACNTQTGKLATKLAA